MKTVAALVALALVACIDNVPAAGYQGYGWTPDASVDSSSVVERADPLDGKEDRDGR